jgi:hypothetical protein
MISREPEFTGVTPTTTSRKEAGGSMIEDSSGNAWFSTLEKQI